MDVCDGWKEICREEKEKLSASFNMYKVPNLSA